jgi:hypothetical protein
MGVGRQLDPSIRNAGKMLLRAIRSSDNLVISVASYCNSLPGSFCQRCSCIWETISLSFVLAVIHKLQCHRRALRSLIVLFVITAAR